MFNLETGQGFYSANGIITHNCRCSIVPVLKSWKEMGIEGLNDLPAGTRASMNGQVPATTTYDEWLRRQPKAFQDDVLGPRRAEIFRGGMPLTRFVTSRDRTLTVRELRKLEAG